MLVALLFAWITRATLEPLWLAVGAIGTVCAELLAYRRPTRVRSLFDRRSVSAVATAGAGIAIGAGAILAPDRALSVAFGACGTYLGLLVVVAATDWTPGGTEQD